MYPGKIELITDEYGRMPVSLAPSNMYDDESPHVLQAVGKFGTIDVLHIPNHNYDICESSYQFLQNTNMQLGFDTDVVFLLFCIKNNLQYRISQDLSPDRLALLELHYTIGYAPDKQFEFKFRKDEDYTTFVIAFHSDFFQRWCTSLADFSGFLTQIADKKPSLISPYQHHATPEMMVIIWEILRCAQKPSLRRIYIESKVLNLLMLSLQNIHMIGPPQKYVLRPVDIEKIQNARTYLIENMQDPCSLEELAYLMGTNDFKLKKGFKEIFGMTVFGLLYEERMHKGRLMILETDLPIKKIACAVGYKSLSNFTDAFKKKFGYPPSSLRRTSSRE
jgi:AraC-like DNA-binding protein